MKFKDKVVIITGASSGIGRQLSLQLAAQGAWLCLAARHVERLTALADECEKLGGRAMAVPTDVGQESQCENLINKTVEKFGRIDVLINNAGFGIKGSFEELPDLDLFKSVIDVNYYGAVYCTRFALPYLKQTKGRIVGVSSILGKIGMSGSTAYCSSKFAMAGFFDVLRLELKKHKVSVTMIYPGYVVTEFAERMFKPDRTLQGQEGRKFYTKSMMTAKRCAHIIIKATARRKRQLIMTSYGVIGVWLNLLAPRFLDWILPFISRMNKERIGGGRI